MLSYFPSLIYVGKATNFEFVTKTTRNDLTYLNVDFKDGYIKSKFNLTGL